MYIKQCTNCNLINNCNSFKSFGNLIDHQCHEPVIKFFGIDKVTVVKYYNDFNLATIVFSTGRLITIDSNVLKDKPYH